MSTKHIMRNLNIQKKIPSALFFHLKNFSSDIKETTTTNLIHHQKLISMRKKIDMDYAEKEMRVCLFEF